MSFEKKKIEASKWFENIRNKICFEFEKIEIEFCEKKENLIPGKFKFKKWNRADECAGDEKNLDLGGGEMSMMNGCVFESVAVNISTVYGEFSDQLQNEIKKNQQNFNKEKGREAESNSNHHQGKKFYATGISLIAHMQNPFVPAVHFNTRFITNGEGEFEKSWFGGGYDLTPLDIIEEDYNFFHKKTKETCDLHDASYYPKFKKQCDEYFYLPHRKEQRGIGGIFYDYLNTGDFEKDFLFTKDIGLNFLEIYSSLVRKNMFSNFDLNDRERLYFKRGRYIEFNLLYDRGTRFGLLTGGNINSILSSLPPIVKWRNEGF